MYGIEGGVDIIRHRIHNIALSARLERTADEKEGYISVAFGLTYRQ
jgi:hypothetical protein